MVKQNPIKQTFGGLANIDDWQFIADTDRTLTVDCYNVKGQWVERLALAIPATPVTARKLCGGKLNNHWWWSVVSISAGTIYGLPTEDDPITTTVGLTLTAGDKLGPAPPNGPVIQAAGIGVVEIDVTGLATTANQTTMITHLSEIEGAVETLEAVDFALEAKQDTQITSLQLIDDFIAGTLGAVGPQLREVPVTFSMAAEAHSAGDVLADSQIMNSVVRAADAKGYLVGFQLLDKDDQAAAQIDVVFLSANVSLGTEGSAVSISDADAANILGIVSVPSTAWCDLINSKLASIGMSNPMSGGIGGLPLPIIPVTGTDDIYVGLIARGTPTVTASGMTGRFFFADGR